MTNLIHSISPTGNAVPLGQERPTVLMEASRKGGEDREQPSKLDAVVEPSVSALSLAADELNEALEVLHTHLRFRLHEDTHRYYVEIVDTLADEVIREVPPKRFLDMIADMYRFMGIIVDVRR